MSFIGTLGMQAAGQGTGNLVNEGMGLLFSGIKNKQQARQQKRLTNIEIDSQKHLTDFNMQKQLELWKATSYGGQMEELRKAGLNPGLLYGMGGGGGTTANISQGNVSGGTAGISQASRGAEGMGLQMPLIAAQVENIKADTELKKVDAAKRAGVDTELANTQIQDLTQGIANKKAQETLTNSQDAILKNELFEKYTTQDWRFTVYEHEASKAIDEARSAMIQADVDESTRDSKIEILAQNAIGAMLDNAYKTAQISKTEAEIKKIANDILLGWAQLSNEQQKTRIQQFTAEFQANHPGVMNVLGGAIQRLANSISKPLNGNKVE